MAKNKKNDPSDAVILLIFFGVLAILLVASIFYQNTGVRLEGTEFRTGEISHEHKDYTWLAIILAVLAIVGIVWSVIRLLKHGTLKKLKKKKFKEKEKTKEELERDELIRAAQEVSEKRQRERELLTRNRYRDYDEEDRRRRYDFEEELDEEENENEKRFSNPILTKLLRFWEKFKRMPVQGKIVIVGAAAGAATALAFLVRMLIK